MNGKNPRETRGETAEENNETESETGSEACSCGVWGDIGRLDSLLPGKNTEATTLFHAFQILLCILHVLVNLVHSFLDPLQLLCKRKRGLELYIRHLTQPPSATRGRFSLLPGKHAKAAALFHPLEIFLRIFHVLVNLFHTFFNAV